MPRSCRITCRPYWVTQAPCRLVLFCWISILPSCCQSVVQTIYLTWMTLFNFPSTNNREKVSDNHIIVPIIMCSVEFMDENAMEDVCSSDLHPTRKTTITCMWYLLSSLNCTERSLFTQMAPSYDTCTTMLWLEIVSLQVNDSRMIFLGVHLLWASCSLLANTSLRQVSKLKSL